MERTTLEKTQSPGTSQVTEGISGYFCCKTTQQQKLLSALVTTNCSLGLHLGHYFLALFFLINFHPSFIFLIRKIKTVMNKSSRGSERDRIKWRSRGCIFAMASSAVFPKENKFFNISFKMLYAWHSILSCISTTRMHLYSESIDARLCTMHYSELVSTRVWG